jgi:endonuclease/exonuclease/phosphatase (EEP) superfamily protein YafD
VAVVLGCGLYAAFVSAIAFMNALGPERWWFAGVNMFLPQLLWAGPGLVLLPLTARYARRWMWLPLATMLFVAGPLMGFSWSRQPVPRDVPGGVPLRVMTYNVQLWQREYAPNIVTEIREADPDVLVLQDARAASNTVLDEFLKNLKVASFGQYIIASKFPIVDPVVGDISYRGETHTFLRARINVHGQDVVVSTAHFATPRDALSAFRSPRFLASPEFWEVGVSSIRRNMSDRMVQARALADALRHLDGPLIVGGDLNAPPPSLASRTLTDSGLVDAFAAGGRGYGYTFGHSLRLRRSFLRLDRILVSRHFAVVASHVGSATGSDHRPVIADVVLARQPR